MSNKEKFIYHSTAYTVTISVLFFLFARIMKIDELSINFLRYFTIFAFSLVLSGSEFIFTINKLNKALKHVIHYVILCIAFFVIFLTVQNSSDEYQFRVSTIFAAVIIFSVFYLILTLLYLFVFKPRKSASKEAIGKGAEKGKTYKSRFK